MCYEQKKTKCNDGFWSLCHIVYRLSSCVVYLSAVCDESSRVEHRSGIHLLLSSHDVFCAGKYFRRQASGQKRARTGHVYRRRNPDRRGPDFKIYASSVTHMDVSDIWSYAGHRIWNDLCTDPLHSAEVVSGKNRVCIRCCDHGKRDLRPSDGTNQQNTFGSRGPQLAFLTGITDWSLMDFGNHVYQETRGNSRGKNAGILRGNASIHLGRDGEDRKFYYLLCTMMCGLMAYYLTSPLSQTLQTDRGVSAALAVGSVMAGSILNAGMRLVLPSLSDKIRQIQCIKGVILLSMAAMVFLINRTENTDNSGGDSDLWLFWRNYGEFSFSGKFHFRTETFRAELWNRDVWDCCCDSVVSLHYKLYCGRAAYPVNMHFLSALYFQQRHFCF